MNRTTLVFSVLALTAAFAGARGRGFAGGGRGGGAPGVRLARGGTGGFSRTLSRPTIGRATVSYAATPSGRTAASRAAAPRTSRGVSKADGGGTSAPAWATPGAMIRTEGQQPVYSDPGNAGTHTVNGGGIIAMDQGRAGNVGGGAGLHRGSADRAPSSGTGGSGGGSGASSNGSSYDLSF